MGRQHIRNGMLSVRQEKTGAVLALPVRPELRTIIEATPGGHLTLLVTKRGKQFTGKDFGEMFRVGAIRPGSRPIATFTASGFRLHHPRRRGLQHT